MTEHTKIPVPAAEGGMTQSLIERAVQAYDLRRLAPAPVPHNLAPAVIKPALRAAAAGAPEAAPIVPVVTAVEAEAVAVPAAPIVAASVPVTPLSGPAEPLAIPALQGPAPVAFSGKKHPIDRAMLSEQGLIVPEGGVTGLLEEFRIIKRQVLANAFEQRRVQTGAAAQRVLICSPHPGEGKSYSAVNLALAIAVEKESEVVLVDADFAKPSVLRMLGLPDGPGLMDALSDPAVDVADCVMATDIPGLWVLPAGNATNSDSEFLSSSRTRAVLDRLTQGAPQRIVIFDSPPALAASPAAELAKYVGQALLIARADTTAQGALEDAVSLLSGCPNIQLLLNAVHFSPSGRRFGSYYGYGG